MPLGSAQWPRAAFVPDYSDGLAPDFHGVPFQAHHDHLDLNTCYLIKILFKVNRFIGGSSPNELGEGGPR